MMRPACIIFLFSLLAYFSTSAHAFPNMVRHGYTSCVSCHFNASGGGALRSYGKYIAQETLGTFNNSDNALPWIKKPVEDEIYTVYFMGRGVQTLYETPQVKRGDFKKMQSDIESVIEYKTWTALADIGPRLDSAREPDEEHKDIFLRRWYVGKQDLNYSVKFGKFFPEYGLYIPNHNVTTRKGLFFNHNQEPQIAQASYLSPTFNFTVAHLKGSKFTALEEQRGYSGTIDWKKDAMRFGISTIKMRNSSTSQRSGATSVFGTVGYRNVGYTMVELARKNVINTVGNETKTNLAYFETGWEVYNGVVPFFNWEYSKNIVNDFKVHMPGVGLQFTPFTHFEIYAQISKIYTTAGDGNYMFTMFNIYF